MNKLIIEFLASFLIWIMFAGLILLWVVDGRIKREEALHALFSFFLAWAAAEIIKRIIPTERPFQINGFTPLTTTKPTDGAFPSGHTAAAFALATTIWLHDKKVGWVYIVLGLAVGAARILANVHYPVDILGGAVLGIIVAFAVEKIHFRT